MEKLKHPKMTMLFGLFGLLFILAVFTTSLIFKEPPIGLRRNISDSLPYQFFIHTPLEKPKRGMYVSFTHPQSDKLLAKQIVGLPGDQIDVSCQLILINGKVYGYIREKTRCGQALTPIQVGVIPEGYVFVHATHPYSFDSRYAEFGLVKIADLQERLWPIF